MSWDATLPADNEAISQGASRIRDLKADLATALTAEGSFPVSASAPKFYPKLKKDTTASRPAASSDYPGRMFNNSTLGNLQRVKDDGSGWEDVTINPATAAIHHAGETTLASVAGVITLDETSNAFYVTGTEAVTSLTGWSAGVIVVRWASARLLTYNATTLILPRAVSRNLLAGDISVFRVIASGQVREIGFFGIGSGREPGDVFTFGGATAPSRSLECDGSSLLRADYPALFAAIGAAHGTADATHFNLPDLRGKFARGYDHGAANDPNAATRTAGATGGATGDNVGSIQDDAFESHTHPLLEQNASIGFGGSSTTVQVVGTAVRATDATGGSETRPKNVGLMYCIAY